MRTKIPFLTYKMTLSFILTLMLLLFGSEVSAQGEKIAICDATVYPSPEQDAVTGATILMDGGKIIAIGAS